MSLGAVGTKYLSASGESGAVGKPIWVYFVHILSGSPVTVVKFYNNGSSGTLYMQETGIVSTGKTIYYGADGAFFPAGCYVTFDANTTSVLVGIRQGVA